MDDRKHGNPWEAEPAETPRAEPEILPPGAPDPRRDRIEADLWMSFADATGRRRIYRAKPRPVAIALTLLALGLVTAAALVLFLGFFLLWLPVAGILVGAAAVTTLLRSPSRRLR
jgi:hypothetical protein